jgi:hypothetical protein
MEPAVCPGDWLLVWRGFRQRAPGSDGRPAGPGCPVRIRPGQLVIARNPESPPMFLVKRVAWREQDGWWLNSDNPRAGGVDSFRFGPVPPDLIEGRVLIRYWPACRR